jgi:AcrR family transcriptional regulator
VALVPERSYHHGNLRSALLEQAARTVREHGADELSLRDLARQLGVSHSAPRRHFADRQSLLEALAADGFVRLGAELSAALDATGPSFADRLHAAAAAYVRFAIRDAALLELMFASKHHSESAVLRDSAERAFSVMLALILQGQAAGDLEPGDPQRMGTLLFATLHGLAALVSSGMLDAAQLDHRLADAVAAFLRANAPVRGELA